MTVLARTSNCKQQTIPVVRNEFKHGLCLVEKVLLVVSLEGSDAKMN
jgi:hypothetical protein